MNGSGDAGSGEDAMVCLWEGVFSRGEGVAVLGTGRRGVFGRGRGRGRGKGGEDEDEDEDEEGLEEKDGREVVDAPTAAWHS